MDELVMSELAESKPKRISGYDRMKRKNQYLVKDVAALEGLVRMLLKHLEAAIGPNVTEQDRSRYQRLVDDIRAELDQVEEPSPPSKTNQTIER